MSSSSFANLFAIFLTAAAGGGLDGEGGALEGKEKVGRSTGPQLWVGDGGGDRLGIGRAFLGEALSGFCP